MKKELIMQ
jgi:hypothetical protein